MNIARGFDPSRYDGYTVPEPSLADLALIGAAVLNSVCTTLHIGHTTPAETLDYLGSIDQLDGAESAAPMIVRDFVAWTGRRQDIVPDARERLEQFIVASGWYQQQVEQIGNVMRSAS